MMNCNDLYVDDWCVFGDDLLEHVDDCSLSDSDVDDACLSRVSNVLSHRDMSEVLLCMAGFYDHYIESDKYDYAYLVLLSMRDLIDERVNKIKCESDMCE